MGLLFRVTEVELWFPIEYPEAPTFFLTLSPLLVLKGACRSGSLPYSLYNHLNPEP